jgi:Tol biopolymer transport system component
LTLGPGARIGVYEIAAQIGEGGMGQVYRATDTRLKRPVAIKVLPPSLAPDAERIARFRREAEVLASLNHPYIAAIYGLEESDGVSALVMELVEGEDLSQRIDRGPIPLDDALTIATQIAEALEAAHEQGIVHRDLKPANIKLRADGTVKVLDFGLAKAMDPALSAAIPLPLANSPTFTSPAVMTQAGIILGTSAYMSPEQARGRAVDRRADIWAFGVVLYEMLVGRQLFRGEDLTEILASVVKETPDLTAAPREVRRLLESCLKKDPRQRLHAIGDWKLLFDDGGRATVPVKAAERSTVVPWLVASVASLFVAALGFVHFRETAPEERPLRALVPVPAKSAIGFLEISPDGRRLVASLLRDGKGQLYLRSLDSPEWQPLPGTENARTPFWSPDSRFIGFFADGQLKVIPAAGGPPSALCSETGLGGGGTWNESGIILFGSERGPLRRVDAAGAPCTVVGNNPISLARFPVFLPDGNHFIHLDQVRGDASSRGSYLAALDDPTPRRLLSDASSVVYSPPPAGGSAHLLFLRDNTLMAQPFDDATLDVVGDSFPVASGASRSLTLPQVAASVSSNGTLVFRGGTDEMSQLTWFDEFGSRVGVLGAGALQSGLALSPDGSKVLRGRRDATGLAGLWVSDLIRGSESRLPSASSMISNWFSWFPDNRRVLFGRETATGARGWYQSDVDGSGEPELLLPIEDSRQLTPSDFSDDGRFLVYTVNDPKTQADIWYVPWDTKPDLKKAVKFAATDAIESQGQVSPRGEWIAFISNVEGVYSVYIRPFPHGPGQWKAPVDGAREPRWSADGKQLYFLQSLNPDRAVLMALTIEPVGTGLRLGTPRRMFEIRARSIVPQSNTFRYSPHPDGRRFLVNTLLDEGEPTINVITHWQKTVSERNVR